MSDKEQYASAVNPNLTRASKMSRFLNQKTVLIFIMIVISIAVTVTNQNFISLKNLFNILSAVSVVGITTVGASMVLITGEFDMTLGPVFSVTAWLMALFTPTYGAALGITAAIAAGIIFGIITGLVVVNVKANSFIVTLALGSVYTGVGLLLNRGAYSSMSGFFTIFKEKIFGVIPYSIIALLLVLLIAALLFKFTKFGRSIFLLGSNQHAAYLSGIKVKFNKVMVFAVAGILYGIASIVLVSQISVAMNYIGVPYTLASLAAAVLGGVVLGGGKGDVLGIFLGVLLFGLVTNAMILMQIDPYWREIVNGAIILIALSVTGYLESKE
ncbi:MAG: ABC transporter permease [Actinobacteria bacterium]|nr:ABC transporter permease [Actinomycetota bacterium]